MNRISGRISAAFTTVTCPGCGKQVVPSTSPVAGAPPSAAEGEKRWSFIWLQPKGAICPECYFPMARYARRLKWIRLFLVGVALVALSGLVLVGALLSGFRGWFPWIFQVTLVVGLAALLVGLLGIVIGGRRRPEDVPPPPGPAT